MIEMIDITAIATHLEAETTFFKFIGTAKDMATAQRETLRYPSAWVLQLSEVAAPSRYENCDMIEQPITVRVGIVLAVRDIADRRSKQALTEKDKARALILEILGRYRPRNCNQVMRFERGALQGGIGKDGAMFWQDDFSVRFDRRIQLSEV